MRLTPNSADPADQLAAELHARAMTHHTKAMTSLGPDDMEAHRTFAMLCTALALVLTRVAAIDRAMHTQRLLPEVEARLAQLRALDGRP